jgi:hypothetical protein
MDGGHGAPPVEGIATAALGPVQIMR